MKIALIGYGRMGKAIEEIALKRGHEIVMKITSANAHTLTKENLSHADVAIEFTKPETAFEHVHLCIETGLPVVCGTTGWLSRMEEIKQLCKETNGSFLYASNFSVGVNILFELNNRLAALMKNQDDYEVTIEETHHIHKKDAPSGTAITLAEGIIASGKKKSYTTEADHLPGALRITSIRKDEVPGTHIIRYQSENDLIELSHEAFNRNGFAAGAVLAAEFIHRKKGIFSMKDVLHT
ncbi:MAG: 4-hydroxy-tetrahydrodipicolinate reductase [Chitinophagaceae bacterium]|nr:4-hydroxy-tetrahydrodipicolinate reductase [Chitinophagaceae bacterium]MCZ2397502.1 4-hydroxy-tetrahydrodipicolinate reductase [Chitinophagales bacterium]